MAARGYTVRPVEWTSFSRSRGRRHASACAKFCRVRGQMMLLLRKAQLQIVPRPAVRARSDAKSIQNLREV